MTENSRLKEGVDFFEKLKKNGEFKRLGKLFKTQNNGYMYDLGTGKIFVCTPTEFIILNHIFNHNGLYEIDNINLKKNELLDCLEQLIQLVSEEKLLQAPPLTEFSAIHTNFEDTQKEIENHLEQITLELTEKCNLRCKYCIYSEENESHRGFGLDDMKWDIAKRAIDYGIEHSGERLAVTFYGGEPLIKLDMIKRCISYIQSLDLGNKEIAYSMTTNMVLVTKEVADYLASIGTLAVVCSLDGPEDIHDANRVTSEGKGSFKKAMRGLKYLVEAFGDRASLYLSISMVMTTPVYEEKLEKIQEFFDSLDWLPEKVTKNISYVTSTKNREKRAIDAKNGKIEVGYVNPLNDWSQKNTIFEENMNQKKIFTTAFQQSLYLKVHKRMIVDRPVGFYNLNGCCVPASRRLYITAKGNFSLCEKIGNAPYVGDVFKGLDFESLKKHYIDDYLDGARKLCENCWAIRFCNSCYTECYDENGYRPEFKEDTCGGVLFRAENALISYHEVLERQPESLEYLNEVELS